MVKMKVILHPTDFSESSRHALGYAVAFTREFEANMIVRGTHGRTGLKHLIFGSVAENVVRKSPCPVLSVRHPSHRFEMPV
jgi:hypothetical protein